MPPYNFRDRTDEVHGELRVIERAEDYISPKGKRRVRWKCLCSCGEITVVLAEHLRGDDHTTSCGHIYRESAARMGAATEHKTTHGMHETPEYHAWHNAKRRTTLPHHPMWKDYGGRGITMAPEWLDNFAAFYEHIGPKPSPELSLDRIDNDGNYEPGNVRWATPVEQANNKRTTHATSKS